MLELSDVKDTATVNRDKRVVLSELILCLCEVKELLREDKPRMCDAASLLLHAWLTIDRNASVSVSERFAEGDIPLENLDKTTEALIGYLRQALLRPVRNPVPGLEVDDCRWNRRLGFVSKILDQMIFSEPVCSALMIH